MNLGADAKYIYLPEDAVVHRPANLTHEGAAAVLHGLLTALDFLPKANIQSRNKVLVFSASGAVGEYAVQLAKRLLGADVTGVCSISKLKLVKFLGADMSLITPITVRSMMSFSIPSVRPRFHERNAR